MSWASSTWSLSSSSERARRSCGSSSSHVQRVCLPFQPPHLLSPPLFNRSRGQPHHPNCFLSAPILSPSPRKKRREKSTELHRFLPEAMSSP
jgi:hypothetical protein